MRRVLSKRRLPPKKEESITGKEFLVVCGIVMTGFPFIIVGTAKWMNFIFSIFN
jgi:hypothetical protein